MQCRHLSALRPACTRCIILARSLSVSAPVSSCSSQGWAFYRIVEPWVHSVESSCSNAIAAFYSVEGSTVNTPPACNCLYCKTRETVQTALDISNADLGTLAGVTVRV